VLPIEWAVEVIHPTSTLPCQYRKEVRKMKMKNKIKASAIMSILPPYG